MPGGRLRELLDNAHSRGYAIPAFNIVDELSMDAVLAAAAGLRSPVVVQVSVRTARFWGPAAVRDGFTARRQRHATTAVLHLDHCRDPEFLVNCLDSGWDSALFDSSHLSYGAGLRLTGELVRYAQRRGAEIEGEFENIARVGATSTAVAESPCVSLADCALFVSSTGVSSFGPNLGTAHGMHRTDPVIDYSRATRLARLVPVVLHGGSGLSEPCLRQVVRSGVSKVNISSALKTGYREALADALASATAPEPLDLFRAVHARLSELSGRYMRLLGSAGSLA